MKIQSIQMQFLSVADKLDATEKAKLETALGCLWYKNEEA
jgi:hypothetical protein